MACILGGIVGIFFWMSNITEKFRANDCKDTILVGAITAVGFFIGDSLESLHWTFRKKFLVEVILVWFILIIWILIFKVLLNDDNATWYILTLTTCFSVPLLFSNMHI